MALLSPLFNEASIDANGDPLSGGKLYTYVGGSSTPLAAYTDSTGAVSHSNPIVLNSRGEPSSPIWLAAGALYKFVLADSDDVTLRTVDGVSGVNDVAAPSVDEWSLFAGTPTYVSGTSFTLVGDQTTEFHVNRRVKSINSGGTRYSTITNSVYSDPNTTVTVTNDSGSLDSGLSSVYLGILRASNSSFPAGLIANVPTGAVFPYAGDSAPSGFLLCDGSAVSRTTYSALFAIVGETYGVGDGSTTFNLPDLGGRVPAGKEASATRLTSGVSGVDGETLGATGGSQAMHQHNHGVTDGGHTHAMNTLLNAVGGAAAGYTLQGSGGGGLTTASATTGISINNAGSGSSQNVQPTIVLNYVIKH